MLVKNAGAATGLDVEQVRAPSSARRIGACQQDGQDSGADALMIAQGGGVLRAIAPSLNFAGLDKNKVKLLGTGPVG